MTVRGSVQEAAGVGEEARGGAVCGGGKTEGGARVPARRGKGFRAAQGQARGVCMHQYILNVMWKT